MGTPRYMSPEVVTGDPVDARSDLFAVGAILFEMLAGRPAFAGRTVAEVVQATLTEQPPALAGSAAVAAVDRVIRRALAKNPAERPASAEAMAEQLNAVRGVDGQQTRAMAQTLTRVVVLPFRVLRPGSRDRFSGVQPAGCDHDVARRIRIADRSIERDRRALWRRRAGPEGARRGGRRRSRGHRHAPALGRSAARGDATGRSARRHAPHVAHRAGAARRSLPDAGRHRAARGGRARAAAGRRAPVAVSRCAARSECLRALSQGQRTGAQLRRAGGCPGAVRAVPRARSGLCPGVGAPGPLPSGDRQVHRRRRRTAMPRRRTRSRRRSR